jgi:hypothetical protein
MSARYAIQSAIVFDDSQPEYLLIEYNGESGAGQCVGAFFKVEDAILEAHHKAGAPDLRLRAVRSPQLVRP